MPNEYLDWIVIPLTAGVVGYITNAIAIRMLFRPHRPHWYTLGWQGIIPRTRAALAANVGKVVGEKLLTEQEISAALQSDELRFVIYAAVCKHSSKSLAELSGGALEAKELAAMMMNQLLPILRNILSQPVVLDRLSGMLITYKDEHSSANMLKRAAATVFLSDEKIVALVRDKVPDLVDDIANDAAMRQDITALIEQKLRNVLDKPLSEHSQMPPQAAIADWISQQLLIVVPQALRHLNISAIVEEKINSLDVKEVEGMLFSFMSSHFRWINILGFVLGFIIGLGQMVFIRAV